MSSVFANSSRNRGSVPDHVIPKTQKLYLMPLCQTQNDPYFIKGKVDQSRE